MSAPHPELWILGVALIALSLTPLAAKLVKRIGEQVSNELEGGRTGAMLSQHLDETTEASVRDEIRQVVIAGNERRERAGERLVDVEAEVDRVMRELDA